MTSYLTTSSTHPLVQLACSWLGWEEFSIFNYQSGFNEIWWIWTMVSPFVTNGETIVRIHQVSSKNASLHHHEGKEGRNDCLDETDRCTFVYPILDRSMYNDQSHIKWWYELNCYRICFLLKIWDGIWRMIHNFSSLPKTYMLGFIMCHIYNLELLLLWPGLSQYGLSMRSYYTQYALILGFQYGYSPHSKDLAYMSW